ncbi:MAG: hypothetical protein KGH75_02660, partial [Rhodospirillales bacterium]|nr:hypothetical protein [Rhodospirillales bacterium]
MAATVIDSLLITLGLDAREYQKGSKDAQDALGKFGAESDKQSKLVGMQSKAIAQGFAQVRNEIIGLVAVAMGASTVKDFFAGMVQGQAHLGRLATNLGMSARALDAWDAAVETVGGSAQGLNASLQNIQAGFEAFKLGEDSPVVQAFRALGINIADANGQVRPMKDLLLDLSAALKGMKPQDQIKVAQMLGLDEGTLNLLREGNVQVKALVDHFEETS